MKYMFFYGSLRSGLIMALIVLSVPGRSQIHSCSEYLEDKPESPREDPKTRPYLMSSVGLSGGGSEYFKIAAGAHTDRIALGLGVRQSFYRADKSQKALDGSKTVSERKASADFGFFFAFDSEKWPVNFGYEWQGGHGMFLGVGRKKMKIFLETNALFGTREKMFFGLGFSYIF